MFAPLARGHIGFVGWYFIGLLVFLCYASFGSRKRIATMPKLPSRTRHFASTLIILGSIFVLALLVARKEWITLYPRVMPPPLQIGVGVALALVLAAGMRPLWRQAVARGDRRLFLFSPQGGREKALWIAVSLMAGVAEETAYRGVLYVLFLTIAKSPWAAAGLSALIFAGNHAVQSNRSMVIIFFFALIFQGLALWTGALYVGMLAHFVFDVIAGFTYSKLVREMGVHPLDGPSVVAASEPAPPAAPASS
jgi:membrane protease YdiL (CAAX protease family)